MAALSPKRRAFVEFLFEAAYRRGAATRAAKRAGYGTAQSSSGSLAVIASRLIRVPAVQEAMAEVGRARLGALALPALHALEALLQDPGHRDHGRAIGLVLDRTHAIETHHNVTVHRTEPVQPTEAVLRRILELARLAGMDGRALPPLIDLDVAPPEETPTP
jgi:phage terminase small subunit